MQADRNLDILRGIAVLAVLVAHCLPASHLQQGAGHYGVLIFFVHTALVLLFSLERHQGPPGLARRFYLQRAFRIYPLSILCVLVTLALHISWPEHVFTPRTSLSIAANLLLIQNFLREIRSISAPLWSLPFEVQMYLVLPVVFWTLRKRGMGEAVVLTVLSLALAVTEGLVRPFPGRWITMFVPCFMGGALAYCRYGAGRRFSWWLWPIAIAVFGATYSISGQTAIFDWVTCIALGLVVPLFREVPVSLVSKLAALVARYSYGIYLAHVPLLWLCFQRLPAWPAAAQWGLFAVLICTVPVALYHLLEEPMIRAGKGLSYRLFPMPKRTPVKPPDTKCIVERV